MDAALVGLLQQTVSVASATTTNLYGETSHGTATELAARVEPRVTQIRKADGAVVPSKAYVYLDGDASITTQSQITLPDGTTPVILAVEKHTDETGAVDHTKVVV
jgi:hypothetical protein